MFSGLTFNRLMLLSVLLAALVLLPAPGAGAQGQSGGTVVICEATGNPNAPYVEVDVAQSDLGNYGAAEGDIIPAPPGGCPTKARGATGPIGPKPKPHRRHPTTRPKATPTVTTPAPRTAAAPALSTAPPVATATKSPDDTDSAPVSSVRALPKTGGHTPVTVVLGLLLLYCGGVIRWASGSVTPRPIRR